MAIYDDVKGNIVRQELQLVEAGQHYKVYSSKVKYSPSNVEKEDFFKLCYGMLAKCDEINVYTAKLNEYEVVYKFIVTNVDIENKQVSARLLSKIDFLNEDHAVVESTGTSQEISLEKIQKLIDKSIKATVTLEKVEELIDEKIKAISEVVAGIDSKVEGFIETTIKYQDDTDDQLEEIEAKLEGLSNGTEAEQTETEQPKGSKVKNATDATKTKNEQ